MALLSAVCVGALLRGLAAGWGVVLAVAVAASLVPFLFKARPTILRMLALVPLIGVLAVIGLYAFGPLLGLYNRAFKIPSVVDRPFVREVSPLTPIQDREHLLAAWRRGVDAGLHQVRTSVEGDPIHQWLITRNGDLTYVEDHTRDTHSMRAVIVERPVAATLLRQDARGAPCVLLEFQSGLVARF